MNDEQNISPEGDTEGHVIRIGGRVEAPSTDDVEGHSIKSH
jgi:hypothetical protein